MGGRRGIGISPKQARFVREYLIDMNGKQAAIRAGYSPRSAEQQASRLLVNAKVAEAVRRGIEKHAKALDLKAEDVLRELADIGYTPVDTEDVRVADKLRALETLAKHLGLLKDDVKVNVSADETFLEIIAAGRDRVAKLRKAREAAPPERVVGARTQLARS